MLTPRKRKWIARIAGAILVLALLIDLSYLAPFYGEICGQNEHTNQKECADYHFATVIFWQIASFVDAASVAITALATAAIAGFTYVLYTATKRQAELTQAAVDLGNKEFISTHRPRLRVRKLSLHPAHDEAPIKAQYEVANVGDTDATLIWADLTVEIPKSAYHGFGESAADDPPFVGADRFMEARLIPPGGHLLVVFTTDLIWRENESRYQPEAMVFRGAVHYRDGNGIERHTAFERFHVPRGRQFGRAEKPDPDYEYED